MTAPHENRSGWTIEQAEQLLLSLKGIVSVRMVTRPGGEVEEIHVLTTEEVRPKQTVRNVESALLAQLDLSVDHRKISVAQTSRPPAQLPTSDAALVALVGPREAVASRLLFQNHQVETERSRKVRHRVELEWREARYAGEASAADLPRTRLEGVAEATLHAIEAAIAAELEEESSPITLALDGVKLLSAFDRQFVLVAVHAMSGRTVTALAGAGMVEESADRAAILATLQATDRWVRGKV